LVPRKQQKNNAGLKRIQPGIIFCANGAAESAAPMPLRMSAACDA
jgi:hypothetical protein